MVNNSKHKSNSPHLTELRVICATAGERMKPTDQPRGVIAICWSSCVRSNMLLKQLIMKGQNTKQDSTVQPLSNYFLYILVLVRTAPTNTNKQHNQCKLHHPITFKACQHSCVCLSHIGIKQHQTQIPTDYKHYRQVPLTAIMRRKTKTILKFLSYPSYVKFVRVHFRHHLLHPM